MEANRRLWLKQIGLVITGVGLTGAQSLASSHHQDNPFENDVNETDLIILRSNENPYGPSPMARKAFENNSTISNRYNWDIASQLITDIAAKNNVKDENILLSAGSTEILDLVAKLASSKPGNYVIADPSYDYWTVTLDNFGLKKIKVPLSFDKKIDLQRMLKAVTNETQLIYLCNPNNPTGTICERNELINFINQIPSDKIILIDEAYLDFTKEQSLSSLININTNIVIAKTFSKIYGLAGARIGYAIAHSNMINNLINVQSNTNNSVSVLSKLAAIATLKDTKFVFDSYSLNEIAREYTIEELKKLNFNCIASNTNFIYFSLENYKKDYFQQLNNHNIEGTRIYENEGKWTRITVGKLQEMKRFIKALQ